jgi:hypothetical protein
MFLREAFEDVCFVFNVRNGAKVARSAWWIGDPLAPFEIAYLDRRFRAAAEKHADISWWADYDRIVAAPSALKGLHDFLGAPFDLERVKAVLATPHGYHNNAEHDARSFAQRSWVRSALWRVGRWLTVKYRLPG